MTDDRMFGADVTIDDELTAGHIVAITDRMVVVDADGNELDIRPPALLPVPSLPDGARLRVKVDVEIIS